VTAAAASRTAVRPMLLFALSIAAPPPVSG
jgi:hypothetical protein